MAKRQEEEAAEREAKVFKLQPSPNPCGYTVVQPFNLSSDQPDPRREARREQTKRDAYLAEWGHGDGSMKTMSNRELINKIMQDDLA